MSFDRPYRPHRYALARVPRMALSNFVAAANGAVFFLLGISPDEADPDLGYIVPDCGDGTALFTVSRFVEKPNAPLARILIDAGALWNTFIVAAYAQALLRVFAQRFPQTVAEMRSVIKQNQCTGDAPDAVIELYRGLPDIDFSREILQGVASVLRVLRV